MLFVIVYNLLELIELLINVCYVFVDKVIVIFKVCYDNLEKVLVKNLIFVIVLNFVIGYFKVVDIVKKVY